MAKSAEMLWLDALEAEQDGDRDSAISLARDVVEIDDSHADAWMAIAQWGLPVTARGRQDMPDLAQAAKAMSALRKVVDLNPDSARAWELGGTLLVDHLGMLEHGLEWWEDRSGMAPKEIIPLVEQLAILVRLGYFDECADRLEILYGDDIDIPPNRRLEARMEGVRKMVERAARMEADGAFAPQDQKDQRWDIIRRMSKRKPISQTFFLLTFVAPIVFLLGSAAMYAFGSTTLGSIVVFFLILTSYFAISRLSMGLLHKLNRHALDLDRALDCETTVGKVCIPEEVRGSKLYNSVLGNRMPAFKERISLIQESGERVPSKWELHVPF
ncbi:MAG: hypothetical protein VX652_02845 [Candidatus Thermoplasmatota archaeon]|nr:hypothetical protein [Candidatus Thermoplasmatota archaeon]